MYKVRRMIVLSSLLFLFNLTSATSSKNNDGSAALMPMTGEADLDADGLPDRWEIEGHELLMPGVARPGHADLIVYIVWRPSLNEADVRNWVNRGVRFYSDLNVSNPDGRKGINLIPIYGGALPSSDDSEMDNARLRERHFPPGWRGIAHWHQFYQGRAGKQLGPPSAPPALTAIGITSYTNWATILVCSTPHQDH